MVKIYKNTWGDPIKTKMKELFQCYECKSLFLREDVIVDEIFSSYSEFSCRKCIRIKIDENPIKIEKLINEKVDQFKFENNEDLLKIINERSLVIDVEYKKQ